MNSNHEELCCSPEWAEHIRTHVIPRVLAGVELGGEMLELGPGAGAATEVLRHRVRHLHALEIDAEAVRKLDDRFAGSNVSIVQGDCARTTLPDASFDSIGTFTMLHHLSTRRRQHAALGEAFRMLRPGGVLLGSDSIASDDLHHFHVGDTYNPLDPAWLLTQLLTIGFQPITVSVGEEITFSAHKPTPRDQEER